MKCPHCGSQLSIEDAYCPFCGHKNEKAKEYTTTMEHYEKELSSAKNKVEKSTHLVKSLVIFLIAAVILCIANIALAFMNKNVYRIKCYFDNKKIERHFDEYSHTMDTLITEGEYFVFNKYIYCKGIDHSRKMKLYWALDTYITDYISIFQNMTLLVFDNVSDYPPDKEQTLTSMSQTLSRFYRNYTNEKDSYPNSYINENHWPQIEVLNQKLRDLFSYYFSMNEQELDEMSNMSEVQIALFLGRRLNIYE